MNKQAVERLQAKTPEQQFINVLENDFHQPPRVAQAVLEEAQSCLLGHGSALHPGQMRVILVKAEARHGQALRNTATREVVWTVDAGQDDREVLKQHGPAALRRVRIQRLLDEAIAQGAVATQEDLAHVLHVSVRTIKRDCKRLESRSVYLPTRGNLKGIGRGQTHKAQIVGRWVRGETYDQIALHTHHSPASIKRYVQTFARVIELHDSDFSIEQTALVLETGVALVREYLAIYDQHAAPEQRERIKEQIARFNRATETKKGAQ